MSSALSWIRRMKGFSAAGRGARGGGAPGPPLAAIISSSGSSCSADAMLSAAAAQALPRSARMSSRSMSSSNELPAPQRYSSPSTSLFFAKRYAAFSSSSLERLYLAIFSSRLDRASSASSGLRSMARRSSGCATFRRWQSWAKARQYTRACRSASRRVLMSRVAAVTSARRCGSSRNFRSAVLTSSSSSLGEKSRSLTTWCAMALILLASSSICSCSTDEPSAWISSL
mmetsp:Transcript_61770/g.199138  ORF Transcript_61770/g.199138 Transcript_61770/m.199138 type:complete len:229 (+) Transcript_61770:360-1046(+)